MTHTLQTLGRLNQTTAGTDPISGGSEVVSYFGKYSRSFGFFPEAKTELATLYFGSRDPTLTRIASRVEANISYVATHGLAYYYTLGKVSNADSGGGLYTHTITNADNDDELPIYTMRGESKDQSGTPNIRKHWLDCKTNQLSINFDDSQGNGMLVLSEMIRGIKQAAPAAHPSLTHPNSDNSHYRRSSSMVFNYDQGGTPVDLSGDLISVTINQMNNLVDDEDWSDGSEFVEGFIETNRIISGNFVIKRDDSQEVFSDYSSDVENETENKKDWRFTVYKNANEYIQHDLSNTLITTIPMNHGVGVDEIPVWSINWVAEGFSVVVVDQLNSSDYFGTA